ncbi:cytochrome P450 [Sinisalibacter aestuarii]|uniref:Cytochrome P450 n=1 Tax=Sinisalibacter aestuarii TaxID=2949426 RepID=A0ABQ5LYW1_9RHOB|nr:cytochrome P450 [Sinisalibacter aestuarii]GKY89953.1 cytochrome P450 [Sinisalibacter aestuarii]
MAHDFGNIDAMIADPRTYMDRATYHALFAHLRREEPVRWTAPEGIAPFWLVSRHADVHSVESRASVFLNAPRAVMRPVAVEEALAARQAGHKEIIRSMNNMDGEEHRQVRAITSRNFLLPSVRRMTDEIDAIAQEFVSRLIYKGPETDFVQDVAVWYPLRVIMALLGVPAGDEALMLKLTREIFEEKSRDEFGKQRDQAQLGFFSYFRDVLEDRRKNPRDDLATTIANGTVNGAPLPEFESLSYCLTVATAGHDTTAATIAGGLLALIENPDQMQKLRADVSLIDSAVEEMLRWVAPVKHFFRTAAEDTRIGETAIRAGDSVMLAFPSPGFDADMVEAPEEFRVDRAPNPHLALGSGPHACLGQHLARLEIRQFFLAFFDRIDEIALNGTPSYSPSSFISGLSSLPVKFTVK